MIILNYEELYLQLQGLEKDLKDKLTAAGKWLTKIRQKSDKGELKGLAKDLAQMNAYIKDFESIAIEYERLTEGFNAKEYMASGDFAKQMTEYCEKYSVDINGEYPVYEIFPFKVKIDSENTELIVNDKRVQCVRPQHFVKTVKQSQDKLNKASFNVSTFLNELANAYDAAIRHKEAKSGTNKKETDLYLKDLYSYLVPMQRMRKEYDIQSYAFDLARLYNSDTKETKDGRGYELGTSRDSNKYIRILDSFQKEQLLVTVRFFEL